MIPTIQSAIPDDWRIQELGALCSRIVGGGTPSRNVKSFWEGDIPWATVKDISGFNATDTIEYISKEAIDKSATQVIPSGTIIIATRMSVGNPVIYSVNTAINQDLKALFTKDEVNKEYLVYFLQAITPMLDEIASGTTVKGLSLDVLTKQKVLMPTNEAEQRAIATALADVDALIEAKRVLLEKKRAIKQGTMQELLTGKLRLPGFPVTPMQHTEIGVLPEDWEVKTLGEIGVVKMCKRIFKHETSAEGDVPFFKIGTFGQQPDAYISREKFNAYRSLYPYPQKGTPLISAAGTIGRVVVYDGQDAYYQDSNIVWLEHEEKDILNAFLRYYYSVINWVTETGSAITRLYNNNILSSQVALPTMKEQAAIASVLADIDSEIATLEQALEKLVDLKQGMMQNLLTGRIRLV